MILRAGGRALRSTDLEKRMLRALSYTQELDTVYTLQR